MTRSTLRGPRTSAAELTNVSPNGLWLLLDGREVFLAFKDFPWFRDATIRELARIDRRSSHHLYWPELDVDLAVESIEHPDRYPLVSQARPNRRVHEARVRPGPRRKAVRKK